MFDDDRIIQVHDRVRFVRAGSYYGTIWHVRKVDRVKCTCDLWLPQKPSMRLTASFADVHIVD